ncbi:putative elongator complex protein 1 [Helicoverpa zea]|uniref:putative elongator complex protein 1 n=1 Tax=Helicoverpa zea TaxID=7113 RepID=UPI001F573C4A|nr:putative elongator complex protein 1 [Helicoverpa zea]
MKNLNVWNVSFGDLNLKSENKLIVCNGHDEVSSSNELYVCTHNLSVICFDENNEAKWTKDLSDIASPDNSPVNITFLGLTNTLCVGLANGELITISDNGNIVDSAGVCDNGLLAMEWSPDQELLVLVTKDMNMILMNMFDPIHEINLFNEEFGEKQFITVGWGKKETQFHGSAGKQAAKLKNEVVADPTVDDDAVKISWRGDGNLYAVGFMMNGIRRFKVFDKEGHLQYTSEKQQGLESNLSWRPSGNLIATTQKLNEKYLVSFFEKNGLKHGEFDVPVNANTVVEDITWSSDSEILTLQCRDTISNVQTVLLYTIGNYHWYLKQTLTFNAEQNISRIMWDNDFDIANNKKLHVFLHNGQHFSYNWIWNVDNSRGFGADDDAVVAVIDGNKLLLTGFRQTVVPPPMSAFEIQVDANINSVHFAPQKQKEGDPDPNSFFVFTSDNKLVFYRQTNKFPLQYEISKIVEADKYDFPFQCYNWFWVNAETLICNAVYNSDTDNLVELLIGSEKIEKKDESSLPAPVARIQSHPSNPSAVFLQLQDGIIVQQKLGEDLEIQDVSFQVACPKFDVLLVENEVHFIGLSHKGHLYMNDRVIMNNVSSFFVHTHFLLLTTLQHVLLCTELTKAGLEAITEYQKTESNHVYKRKIERGAKLVIAVPNDTRTVFQMPRGNLETIQPRPLSLKIIGEYLDRLQYHEAFDLMRKQRINLNLIYDHDPDKFVKNIEIFLESVQNISWLNLFLSDLENSDVTKTMYSSSYAGKPDKPKTDVDSKIQNICDIVREYLKKRTDSDSKILPLLTTFVKKNTMKDLESALSIIKELKIQESGGSKLPVGSDEALKYLLYMVDVNQLFDVALGMYDFDLVLLVAYKSQKDPKEYVPMLDELNEMEENYKRFTINKHLKRFDRAVESLVLCGEKRHNELKTFVKYHSLYREALALFSPNDEIFKEISDDFGLYLKLKKQFTEAGLVYERAQIIDKAIECYKEASEWELAISLAKVTWPEADFKNLCWDLVNGLKEQKRHKEALTVLDQYYGNNEETISYAIECGQYKTALTLCSQYQKSNWKDEKILPAILEEYKNMKELIENNFATFIRHRERLQFVRENKTKHPVDTFDFYTNKDSDLYSDAGSTLASSSRGSSRSFRSSKNRRKHERKVASLKEGSQYEDVALVMTLHTLVTATFDLRLQIKEVVIALSYFSKDKEAYILQTSLEKVLKEMKDSFKQIWTNELVLEATNATIAAQNVPEGQSIIPQGIATLEPHIRIAPVIADISWKLEGLN